MKDGKRVPQSEIMAIDTLETPPRSPGVLATLGAYLWDGIRVLVLPVTTIANAANRELSVGLLSAVLIALTALSSLLTAVVLLVSRHGDPQALSGEHFWPILAAMPFEFGLQALLLVSFLALNYGAIKLLRGSGSLRRFLSAALVVETFELIAGAISVLASFGGAALTTGEVPSGVPLILGLIGLYFPVFILAVGIAYYILVARFGGLLDYGRAVLATLVAVLVVIGGSYLFDSPDPVGLVGLLGGAEEPSLG